MRISIISEISWLVQNMATLPLFVDMITALQLRKVAVNETVAAFLLPAAFAFARSQKVLMLFINVKPSTLL